MDKKLEHTPTPYRAEMLTGVLGIKARPNIPIATMSHSEHDGDQREGNAAFILRACNNHDALVSEIKQLAEAIDDEGEHDHDPEECDVCYAVDDAKRRLARLAEEGETGAQDLMLEAIELITDMQRDSDDLSLQFETTPAFLKAHEDFRDNCQDWLDKAKGKSHD